MTITIQDDFAVEASETYDFHNEIGFIIPVRGDGTISSFWNFGAISLSVDDGWSYSAIRCAGGDPDGIIENAAGGVIRVQGGAMSTVIGLDAESSPSIVNDGTIDISSGGSARGISVYYGDDGQTVSNSGLIHVRGAEFVAGIAFAYGGDVDNSGTIKVRSPLGGAVGVSFGTFHAHLDNTGRIIANSGSTPNSVGVSIDTFWDGSTFINHGLIRADFAIRGDISGHTITNAGVLDGDVWLTGGQQGLVNTGKITGDILLGFGADTFDGSHGKLVGGVYGGAGSDLLVCGRGDQTLHGDGIPQNGDDGSDTLVGGAGSDTLVGGGGGDSFLFQHLGDSGIGSGDLIKDLSDTDIIDLSAIDADRTEKGDQAFHLASALDGHAGQAALVYSDAAHVTLLQLDVDGDGVPDAEIILNGDHAGFTNFVL